MVIPTSSTDDQEPAVPTQSYVVTAGAAGIGRAIVERLARDGPVVVLDLAERRSGRMAGSS